MRAAVFCDSVTLISSLYIHTQISVEQQKVQGMEGLHYDNRLKCLNLMRLETRRVRSDLIKTFKIVNGKYSINSRVFLNMTKVEEEDIQRNYFKRGPDWTLKIFHSVIEW